MCLTLIVEWLVCAYSATSQCTDAQLGTISSFACHSHTPFNGACKPCAYTSVALMSGRQTEAVVAAERADAAAEAALGTAKESERQKRAAERKLVRHAVDHR